MCGFGFMKFEGMLFKGLIEVDLFEGVHELGDGLVLFLGFVGLGEGMWWLTLHNDIILLIIKHIYKILLRKGE